MVKSERSTSKAPRNSPHVTLTLGEVDQFQLSIEQVDSLCAMAEEHAEHDPRLLTALGAHRGALREAKSDSLGCGARAP